MKKLFNPIIIIAAILFGPTLHAQDDFQKVQEAWGKDKRELVRIGMSLSPADSTKFWPVYNQYEAERQKIGRERLMILNDYAANYTTMTNAKADEIINRIFKNDAALTQLQQQYYTKFKSTLNAMQAARFMHIESYLQSSIRAMLQGELPVIGELDSLKHN